MRIAIVSLLFNWPSTGGGTVHTAELGSFLERSGYAVRHYYAEYPAWGLGDVRDPLLAGTAAIAFTAGTWTPAEIRRRFHAALQQYQPDVVIVTDSWNTKPLLAEACAGFPYLVRIAAQECLCPLNNVRLLPDAAGGFGTCPSDQLSTPGTCRGCVERWRQFTGDLHRAERQLAGFSDADYPQRLQQALGRAEAVLVVNPEIGARFRGVARDVRVIPSGFDGARFPWPWPVARLRMRPVDKTVLLFAGLPEELMKGFHVLQAACRKIWTQRQDFVLWVTADRREEGDPFVEWIGWQSQQDLPGVMRSADVVVVPTIAEEALGRTAVEALGAGRPVVASRIGGLPYAVADQVTGLLVRPGDPEDLARALVRLMDDADWRHRLGCAGRRRFFERYTWEQVIDREYRPLLDEIRGRRELRKTVAREGELASVGG